MAASGLRYVLNYHKNCLSTASNVILSMSLLSRKYLQANRVKLIRFLTFPHALVKRNPRPLPRPLQVHASHNHYCKQFHSSTHSSLILSKQRNAAVARLGTLLHRSYHDDKSDKPCLKLMDFPEIIWPSPIKSFRNWWFSKLIQGYYDHSFSIDSFLTGSEQAINYVSNCLAEGDFDELQHIVEPEALQEIQNNYADLSYSQRTSLAIKPEDIFLRFIYEIGMMFDDNENQRFVEITVVFQGFHGFYEAKQKDPREYYEFVRANTELLYVCNYRFIRDFTKGVSSSDWIINKLNHFIPNELTLK
ncbi:uncharacterized protein LOC115232575 [Octopus sinensis]|uniref:Uncharacterized protein LOC115232575 n=1 Tax=Octopus sinensis TaxID=2607531 RepID=A0A6P7U118_9MOLL|nr:uncharacterized protein LOC115232575 [Octopus sinensis]